MTSWFSQIHPLAAAMESNLKEIRGDGAVWRTDKSLDTMHKIMQVMASSQVLDQCLGVLLMELTLQVIQPRVSHQLSGEALIDLGCKCRVTGAATIRADVSPLSRRLSSNPTTDTIETTTQISKEDRA